jgi:hypothetical protein
VFVSEQRIGVSEHPGLKNRLAERKYLYYFHLLREISISAQNVRFAPHASAIEQEAPEQTFEREASAF